MKKLLALVLCVMMLLGMTSAMAQETAGKDIIVLYTNDVHCGVSTGLGLAGVATYRDKLIKEGNFVTLVDNGDAIQGEAIGTLSTGSTSST